MNTNYRIKISAIVSAWLGVLGIASAATASPIFELELANPGVSIFRVRNLSTASEQLAALKVSIGDVAWNFDIVDSFNVLADAGDVLTPALVQGDMEQDLVRVDELAIGFTGFEVGDRFQFTTDIDQDGGNTVSDFRTIYWNNGDADNAVVTFIYLDADQIERQLAYTLPDDPDDRDVYSFVIPEPTSLALLGLGGLALRRRRR